MRLRNLGRECQNNSHRLLALAKVIEVTMLSGDYQGMRNHLGYNSADTTCPLGLHNPVPGDYPSLISQLFCDDSETYRMRPARASRSQSSD